jgi:hypothetical protein
MAELNKINVLLTAVLLVLKNTNKPSVKLVIALIKAEMA